MSISAIDLNVSVSAISSAIRKLETLMCFPLFLRTHLGLMPAVGSSSFYRSCLILLCGFMHLQNKNSFSTYEIVQLENEVDDLLNSTVKMTTFFDKVETIQLSPALLLRFIIVYQQGSINKAAALLTISQPQLSRQIKQIEKILNVQFFKRDNKGLLRLEAADEFYKNASKLNDITEHLVMQGNQRFSRDLQTTKIGTVPPLSSKSSLSDLICHLCRQWSDPELKSFVSIDVATANVLVEKLRNNELDVAIVDSPHVIKKFSERIISHSPIVLAGTNYPAPCHNHNISHEILLDILETRPFVLPYRNTGLRGLIDRWMATHNLEPKFMIEVESVNIAVALIRNSGYFSFLSYCPSFENESFQISKVLSAPSSTLRMIWKEERSEHTVIKHLHKQIDIFDDMMQSFK